MPSPCSEAPPPTTTNPNYRAFDLYHKPVVSLAILGDDRESWRPSHYQTEFMNCRLRLDYPIVKLLDYAPRWSELESSANPFAVLVMAHLKTKTTTGKPEERAEWKRQLDDLLRLAATVENPEAFQTALTAYQQIL